MRRSFKTLEHELIIILSRRGYVLNTKIKDVEATDTKIYTKGLLELCTISVHRADTSSITLTFSENCIQMTYSALIVITFDSMCNIKHIFVDHTECNRYSAIYAEINDLIERI